MARKHNGTESSGLLHFDSRTKAVIAQAHTMDNMKEKISKVREFSPSSSRDDIIQVLHHFDGDLEETIDAYRKEAVHAILSQWNVPNRRGKAGGSNQKMKNKKKKHKGGVEGDVISEEPTVPNNNNNVEKPTHPRIDHIGQANGHVPNSTKPKDSTSTVQAQPRRQESAPKSTQERGGPSRSPKREPRRDNPPRQNTSTRDLPNQRGAGGGGGGKNSRGNSDAKTQKSIPPKRTSETEHRQQSGRRRNTSTSSDKGGKGDRARTISESSTSQDTTKPKNPSVVLERVSKDLQRTQVSLTRHKNLLNEEFDKSEKRLRKAYEDARHSLEQRESEMLRQLKEVKRQATNLLDSRQVRAVDLKLETARAVSMSEQQLNVLRADIKHFVSERKVDEELGRTMRFVWNPDPLEQAINTTGEVIPIQTFYTTRRPSMTSDTSGIFSRPVSVSEDVPLSRSSSRVDGSSVPVTPTSPDMDMKTEVEHFAARLQRSLDSRGGPRRPRNDRSRSQGRPGGKDKRDQGNQGQKTQDNRKEQRRPEGDEPEKEKSNRGQQRQRNRGGQQGRQNRGEQGRQNRNQGPDSRGKDHVQNRKEPNRERLSSSSSTGKGEESPEGSPKKSHSVRRREQYRRRHYSNKDEADVKDTRPEDSNAKPKDSQPPKPENTSQPKDAKDNKDSTDKPLVNGTAESVPENKTVEHTADSSKSDLHEDSNQKPERPNELKVVPNGPKVEEKVKENHIEDADHSTVDTSKEIKSKLIPNGVIHSQNNHENGKSDEVPMTNGTSSSDGESLPIKENGEGALPQRKPRERKERGEKATAEVVKEVSAMNGVAVTVDGDEPVDH